MTTEDVPDPIVRGEDPPDDDGPPIPQKLPSAEPPLSPVTEDFHDASSDMKEEDSAEKTNDVVEKVTDDVKSLSVQERDDTSPVEETAAAPPKTPPRSKDNKELEAMSTPILNPKVRDEGFQELRAYEAKRRSIYMSKLNSSSLYWRSFRDLLSKAYQETERAEDLVRGSVVANRGYFDYLNAAAADLLDQQGNPMDERKGKRLKEEKIRRYNRLGGGGLLVGLQASKDSLGMDEITKPSNGSSVPNTPQAKKTESSEPSLREAVSFEGLPDDSLVSKIIEAKGEMANHFHENVTFVEDVVLVKLVELRKELQCEVNVMSLLGDNTIGELERAEDDVQDAWEAYYVLAARSINAGARHTPKDNAVLDVWLVEMHYRMSVAYLTTIWEKSSVELSNLFTSMKELECNRRFRLRELLVLYMKRADRLWSAIPGLITPVLEDLVEAPSSTDVIEKDIQTIIRTRAQSIQRNDEADLQPDRRNGPGLAGAPALSPTFELQSPLLSNLLLKVDVIWKKSEKVLSVWKPTLAIATTDSYLHLFEIPHTSTVQTGTAPEVAFQALVPPVEVVTEEAVLNGRMPSGRSWFEYLIPSDSLNLKNCTIGMNKEKGNATFEITEASKSQIKFIKKEQLRKISLRMFSSQHMVEWLLTLKEIS